MHVFDLLREWASRDEATIREMWVRGSLAALPEIIELLAPERQTQEITDDSIFDLIQFLYGLYASGSRQLGEAIIIGSDYVDQGDFESAIRCYEQFIETCHSPFYQRIAKARLHVIRDKS